MRKSSLLMCLLVCLSFTSQANDNPATMQEWVPSGFEELLEPQTTEVDVYYGNIYIGSSLAKFTDTEISLSEADKIIQAIPDLVNPVQLVEFLENGTATNHDKRCETRYQVDCGVMHPQGYAVIFDSSIFRVDIFVGPEMLLTRAAFSDKYLPESDGRLAYLQYIDANLNGINDSVNNYTITNTSHLTFRENNIRLSNTFIQNQSMLIDSLSYSREFKGKKYEMGLFNGESKNFSFIRDSYFAGIHFGDSLNTRQDLDMSEGSSIEIYLPVRSRVDIYRDGRLLSTAYYNIGNQILDTTTLPDGSYDIEIVISDERREISRETRFYSKTPRLPPQDHPLFFVQAGQKVKRDVYSLLPELEDNYFIRGGYGVRLNDHLGASVAASHQADKSVIETSVYHQGRHHEIQTNLAYSSDGQMGVDLYSRLNIMGLTISNNVRKIWDDTGDVFSDFGRSGLQANSNISFRTDYGMFNVFARYNKNRFFNDSVNYGVRFSMPVSTLFPDSPYINVEVSRNNDATFFMLTASYQFFNDQWYTSIDPQVQYASGGNAKPVDFQGLVQTQWNNNNTGQYDLGFGMSARSQENNRTLESRLYAGSPMGVLDVQTGYSTRTDQVDYIGRLSTNLAMTASGVEMGGDKRADSGVIVLVQGEQNADARFDVRINDRNVATITAGVSQMIPLTPFATYTIEVIPTGNSLVSLKGGKHKKTLYPGNIINLEWETRNIFVLFGKVMNQDGVPLQNALIKNADGMAMTETDGYFQAEFEYGTRELVVQKNGQECIVKLPEYSIKNQVVVLDELVCI